MRRLAAVMAIVFGAAGSARAQESGHVGITMGYPASIGVIWHVSDRIALRPEVSLQQISGTSTSVITITTGFGPGGQTITTSTTTQATSDQWAVGVGASALFYVKQWDALRTYVSPRFQYSRGSSSSQTTVSSSVIPIAPTSSDFTQTTYLVSGSFGAQYGLGTHFGLYGEVGFSYSHNSSESTQAAAGTSDGHTIGTRSGVGVIFYF